MCEEGIGEGVERSRPGKKWRKKKNNALKGHVNVCMELQGSNWLSCFRSDLEKWLAMDCLELTLGGGGNLPRGRDGSRGSCILEAAGYGGSLKLTLDGNETCPETGMCEEEICVKVVEHELPDVET